LWFSNPFHAMHKEWLSAAWDAASVSDLKLF
jgi:hypothetical protein